MVLRYMVSDTDLEKVELRKPEKEVVKPSRKNVPPKRKLDQPKRNRQSSKKSMKLRLFLMVTLCIAVYYFWTADLTSSNSESSPANKEVVIASIVYSQQNASALVSNRIVYEGDIVDGYKVVKIHRDKVEFEKDGKSYTKQVSNYRIPLAQRLVNMRNSIKSTVSRWKWQLEI